MEKPEEKRDVKSEDKSKGPQIKDWSKRTELLVRDAISAILTK